MEAVVQGAVGSAATAGGTAATTTATQTHIPSIAGIYVEASSKTLSLSEASQEHLLGPDLALALLEAQAATGGLVNPVRKQLVSVAEALGMGLVGLEMKERLLCAERAVTGFADPYSEEKISLCQAVQKELVGREQGLRLLEAQIATGGIIEPTTGRRVPLQEAYARGYLEEDLGHILSDPGNEECKGFLDPNGNQKVTYSELMRRCIVGPCTGLLLLPLKVSFPGLRGTVCSHELLDAGILDSATFKALHDGELSAQEVAEMDTIQQYLSGTNSITGVALLQSGAVQSLYQAMSEHLLMPGTAEILLQAQAATGGLTDPLRNKRFTVDGAVRAGVVGPELYEKLSSAEKAVTGYKDPFTGETLSLFQAMGKGLVPRDPGLFLLEAQLATGGIVDPHTHHRLPVEVACQRGHLDKDTHSLLCNPTDDTRGFFEPNAKQNMSYKELLSRCVADPETGLCLLPLTGDPGKEHSFIDHRSLCALKSTTVPKPCGQLRGRPVSLWKLLFSDYVTREQCRALTQQFCSGSLSTPELADRVTRMVQEGAANSRATFEGLRDKVTPAQLLSSEIINKDLFEKLTHGETLAKEVLGTVGTVKRYLEGTGSIAGLLLPDSQEKISIYRAKRKGLLRPGTSLILLEAQAATGHIIDPAANQKYTVDEALRANVIGPDVYDKLLSAERAVTGYRDPYTGQKISLFQAMTKDLIVKAHAIRLLEAQIATGGIVDPVNSHRLPVEAAYKRGYLNKKMNLILSDPSEDTKGFFDPNTHENLTYRQLKERCLVEPSTGLCLLPLNSRRPLFIDDGSRQALRGSWLPVRYGRLRGQRVSVWALLNSEYFSEGKRREMLSHYASGKVTLKQLRLLMEEETKKRARIQFPTLRGSVTAHRLMETGIISRDLFEKLLEGVVSPEEVLRMDSVRRYLCGTGSIGGIVLQPSHKRVSFYEAMKRNMVLPGVALPLLEAQVATGFLIDPVNNQKLGLDEAVRAGVVGPELYEKLHWAEEAVTGYQDPFTGRKVSLFQAMKKGLVADTQAMQLMDAQLSTGGVMDPHSGHYVPIEFAQKKGYLDDDFHKALSNPRSDAKAFSTLDRKEKATYGQLIHRCERDEASGIHLLPLPETASPIYTDEQMEQHLRETLLEDRGTSLWELLSSGYFTEEQRRELLEKFRSEALSLQQLASRVQRLVKEIELKAQTQITFQGLRGEVPAVWLLDTGIISEETFVALAQGRRTAREVSEMESVKPYLNGTGSISGVFLQDSKEKMGLYQAMQNGFLLPGMGRRLLEAQAATGSIVDPATNKKVGVEEAIKAGLVGEEIAEQLLQAERALTGYPDPYSGKPISVCQAIRKELIPAHVGIPLLEAQLATGGVVDPVHHHHLPLQAAYCHGFLDEDMHKALSQPSEETCIFLDPNTQESLTYQQLKDRCLRDPATGLFLLPLSKDAAFYGDQHTTEALKSIPIRVNVGQFKGQEVSLWDLLNSEYITKTQRRELLLAYQAKKAEALREMIAAITQIMEETEQQGRRFTFKGLRKQVSATDLFQSQLIDKGTLDDLRQGKKTVLEVTKMDSVQPYLEGSNFIAGVLLQPSGERMGIYQAMMRGLLRPGAALVLLEAQAATGFLIDPVGNKRLSVDEAMAAGLVGGEIYGKLLSAEKAVTGYTHPYTKRKISLFEAMKEELIVRSHGIRLLEAQIATGGIIDPVQSHRIPVEVAYRRGYFDEQLNQILLDPTDDTKGFFDPNTHENLTYLQLLERCTQDPETGLYMLQIVRRGGRYFYIDEATKQFLKAQPMQLHVGRYTGQAVSMWDLLCSPYIQEHKRKDLVRQYKGGSLTLDQLGKAINAVIEETEQRAQAFQLEGPRGKVSAADLFNSEIIDKKTLDGLHQEPGSLRQLAQKDSVRRFLEGTGCIAGVLAEGQRMTVSEATERGLLSPENGLMLLEAQAATGFLTDPVKKRTFSVDQAVLMRLVGEDVQTQLRLAENAVTGYTDPPTGDKVSLYQAMKRNIVEKGLAFRLLEAQVATGGIMDPFYGHRIPVEVAYKRGHLDEATFLWLSDAEYARKGFVDPNTQERVTYAQLLERCIKDANSGMYLLPLLNKTEYFYVDEVTKHVLLSTKVNVTHGKFRGQTASLWELLSSDYVDEEKKKELIQKYKQGPSAVLQHIAQEVLNMVKEKEEAQNAIWFPGLRQQVAASELLEAEIISRDTMQDLEGGKQTTQEVARMDAVRRYLEGTGCIAGMLVPTRSDPAKLEKMTIYQAMWKGIVRPGTALVLLEAQAATGFIIDPLKKAKLSVSEAISAGLVGGEIQNKLLSAEKAVTGYMDPNNGEKISLFQAMKKGLILKEHGIRLLEAQIATGGIIDPVHSHRVPVEVAYKRGYFDEEMNHILADPTDDTKGFFDPNTHENLTYMQLLQRCIRDTDTGLMMLQVQDQSLSVLSSDENMRQRLQSIKTTGHVGRWLGRAVSAWDLLCSGYIPEAKKKELLGRYSAGTISAQELISILESTIKETEEQKLQRERKQGTPNGSSEKVRCEEPSVEDLPRLLADTVTRGGRHPLAPEAGSPDHGTSLRAGHEDGGGHEEEKEAVALGEEEEEALKSRLVNVAAGEFHGQRVSVWDLLHSRYIPEENRKELLQCYRSGILTADQMETVVTTIVNKTEEKEAEEKAKEASHTQAGSWEDPLRSHVVVLHAGHVQGQEASLWDLLFSQYVPGGHREELLVKYRSGTLSLQEMIGALVPLLTEAEGGRSQGAEQPATGDQLEAALRQVLVEVPVGEFQGNPCSLWELLFSKYVSTEKRHELLEKHRAGSVGTEQLVRLVVALIEEMEEKSNQLKFSGLRRQVSASELFSAQIIDRDTLSKLTQGTKTVEEVTELDSVKRYLEGTSCLAGVLVPTRSDPAKTEKMTIYQAMWKGILRPGTALVLLEAQAATGFITDPLQNRKLSVDEAVAAEVVGAELREKLLSAERAVTGYKDPYTGGSLSLFQAMKTGLIVKDHGVRLLEAQIATGGVIDPVHSHRLPVDVAYRRGFFDEEMNRTLSDPTDDTKGFFDPNTHENLTYKQLLNRCLPDPDTGLLLLHVMGKGSSSLLLNESTRKALQSARVTMDVGLFQGQGASVWDLLFSRYIPPQRREELLRQYKSGTLTLERLTHILTTTVLETEERSTKPSGEQGGPASLGPQPPGGGSHHQSCQEEDWQKALRSTTINMPAGEHQGHPVLVWDLLFSDYISEEKRTELMDLYRRGLLPMDRLISVLTTLVQKKQATARKLDVRVRSPGPEEVGGEKDPGVSSPNDRDWGSPLRDQRIHVSLPELHDQQLSVWDLLFSRYVSESQREELLGKYRMGNVTLEELMDILAALLANTVTGGGGHPLAPEAGSPDHGTSLRAGHEDDDGHEEEKEAVALGEKEEEALKSRVVNVAAGEFHGQRISVWDLLHSRYIPEENRKELLQCYRSGILTADQMETVVTTIVNKTEEKEAEEKAKEASHTQAGSWEDPLRSHMVVLHAGHVQGQEVSLWDLLFSQYISERKREELLCMFRYCHLSPEELTATLSDVITEMVDESKEHSACNITSSSVASSKEADDVAVSSVSKLTLEPMGTLASSPGSKAEEQVEPFSSGIPLVPTEPEIPQSSHYDIVQNTLRQEKVDVTIREIHGEKASVWDPFFSRSVSQIRKEETLHRQGSPTVSVKENIRSVTTLITEAESPSCTSGNTGEVPEEGLPPTGTLASFQTEPHALKSRWVDTFVDGLNGQQGSLWDLLHSHDIPEEKRKELLHLFKSGKLTLDQVQTEVTAIINKTLDKETEQASQEELSLSHDKESLLNHTMEFQGQEVSVWDLLFSYHISGCQREDLLAKYRNRRVTLEELRSTLDALLVEATSRQCQHPTTPGTSKPDNDDGDASEEEEEEERETLALGEKEEALKSRVVNVSLSMIWPLAPEAGSPDHGTSLRAGHEDDGGHEEEKEAVALGEEEEEALKSRVVNVAAGEFHGQRVSVWDLLHSRYIPEEKRKELLQCYRSGILATDQMETVVTTIVNKTEEEKASAVSHVRSPMQELGSPGKRCAPGSVSLEKTLRSEMCVVPVGDLQGQEVSCWELLSSKYISKEKKQELLSQFEAEALSAQELAGLLTSILTETRRQEGDPLVSNEDGCQAEETRGETAEDSRARQLQLKLSLRTTMVPVAVGEYKGQEVRVLDLLFSKYVPQEKRQELLELYRAGTLPVQAMVTTITSLIEEAEGKGGKSGKKKKRSCMKGALCWKDRGDHP